VGKKYLKRMVKPSRLEFSGLSVGTLARTAAVLAEVYSDFS
jgi:hypothetical protein